MASIARLGMLILLLFLAGGCADKKMLVALVPDPDGKVGSIVVENAAGKVSIDSPYQATTVRRAEDGPAAPAAISKNTLDTIFREALSIQPRQPLHFLLYFFQDTTFTNKSLQLVPKIITAIQERNSTDIMVEGHTDTLAGKEYNTALSTDRAVAVKKLLVEQGVDSSAIRTISHGEENPLIPTGDNVYEPKNRRVEVVVR